MLEVTTEEMAQEYLQETAVFRSNNAINSDSEKRRAFAAPLFTAGYGER
ncbi:MAG: hypothetical protein V9G21_04425 [Methylotenera sp.]